MHSNRFSISPSRDGNNVIILGKVTVIVRTREFFIIPETPLEARVLSAAEKLASLIHVSVNRTGIRNKLSQIVEMLVDPQLYLMTILTILVRVPLISSLCLYELLN